MDTPVNRRPRGLFQDSDALDPEREPEDAMMQDASVLAELDVRGVETPDSYTRRRVARPKQLQFVEEFSVANEVKDILAELNVSTHQDADDDDTDVQQQQQDKTPAPYRARNTVFSSTRRPSTPGQHLIVPDTAVHVLHPGGGGAKEGALLFDVYTDTPFQVMPMPRGLNGGGGGAVRGVIDSPVLIKRQVGNIEQAARSFSMRIFSFSTANANGAMTKVSTTTTVSREPKINVQSRMHTGRCEVSFISSLLQNQEDKQGRPCGVIVVDRRLLPSHAGTQRVPGSELPVMDPLFIAPTSRHITVVMPEMMAAFRGGLDHFVIELRAGDNKRLACIAVHKAVFVAMLSVWETTVRFYDVPIAEGVKIGLLIHVHRMRRNKEADKLYIAIERVDFFLPEGFERIAHVDQEDARRQHFRQGPARRLEMDDDEQQEQEEVYARVAEPIRALPPIAKK